MTNYEFAIKIKNQINDYRQYNRDWKELISVLELYKVLSEIGYKYNEETYLIEKI